MKCHWFAHPASRQLGTNWKARISMACGWSHLAGQTTLDTTVSHSVHWGHRSRLHQQGAWQSSTGQGHSCLHFATSWHWWPHQHQAMCPVGNKCMVMGNCDTVQLFTKPDRTGIIFHTRRIWSSKVQWQLLNLILHATTMSVQWKAYSLLHSWMLVIYLTRPQTQSLIHYISACYSTKPKCMS